MKVLFTESIKDRMAVGYSFNANIFMYGNPDNHLGSVSNSQQLPYKCGGQAIKLISTARQTVLNVTGAGWLSHIVLPTAASTQFGRVWVTIDGIEYFFEAEYSSKSMVVGFNAPIGTVSGKLLIPFILSGANTKQAMRFNTLKIEFETDQAAFSSVGAEDHIFIVYNIGDQFTYPNRKSKITEY